MANKNTNFKNRLVLCLAHRPLQPNELDNLISEAVTSSHNYKAELEQEQAKGLHASTNNEQKENTPNTNTTQIEMSASYKNLNPTVHCLITGSPDVSAPGKSFDDCLHKEGNFHLLSGCSGHIEFFENSLNIDEILLEVINAHRQEYDFINIE